MGHEFRDVLFVLPQGWQVDFHYLQSVIQVLAKAPARDFVEQAAVGGCNDARIDGQQLGAAHWPDMVVFKRAQ